jgi:hypothetical protein
LQCVPPAPSPPVTPPLPPTPPPLPPGSLRVNVSEAVAPQPVRDYSRMIVDDETLLFVGGYVTTGTQAVSWGDPTTIALVAAARHSPPPPPGEWPVPLSGELYYGNCTPGCGRSTGADECIACARGSFGDGDGICRLCAPGHAGNGSRATEKGACARCLPGSYSPIYGATACTTCPVGAFCADGYALTQYGLLTAAPPRGGIAVPVLCPVGTYNPLPGSVGPDACRQVQRAPTDHSDLERLCPIPSSLGTLASCGRAYE